MTLARSVVQEAAAVAWLANTLASLGTEILPGQFIMSSSFTTAATTISGLGAVSLTFS
jgi:2-keto-4-pentenoate hydratase